MTWKFCEDWYGTDIEEAFDADGKTLNLFRIKGGKATTKDNARGQAYALSVAPTPETPEKKTGIRR